MMFKFSDYVEEARRTNNINCSDNAKIAMLAMGLAGEAGEVVDELKKIIFHKHPLNREKLTEELGDIMWYYTLLLDYFGISLNDVLFANIKKLRSRYPNGFTTENSINRGDK